MPWLKAKCCLCKLGDFCFFVACACWAVYSTRVNRYYLMLRDAHTCFSWIDYHPNHRHSLSFNFGYKPFCLAQERLFWLWVQAPALTLPSPPCTLLNKMAERKKARVVSASRSCLMQTYARVFRRHFRRPTPLRNFGNWKKPTQSLQYSLG